MSAILAAAVRVANQFWRRALVAHGSPQRHCGQALRHPLAHRIANQLAGKNILDARQVEPSFAGGHIRDVSYLRFVRAVRRKGLIQQILHHRQVMI